MQDWLKEVIPDFEDDIITYFEEKPRPSFECPKCGINGKWLWDRECYYCDVCHLIFSQGYTDEREMKNQPLKYYSPDENTLHKWLDSICELKHKFDEDTEKEVKKNK